VDKIVQLPRVRNAGAPDAREDAVGMDRGGSSFTLPARAKSVLLAHARQQAGQAGDAGMQDDDEVQVVRFEPLENPSGALLMVAHVYSARLSELCGAAEHAHRTKARLPTLVDRKEALVQLEVQDVLKGQAVVRVERGVLGAMSIELRLEQGRLGLVALVANARAAAALEGDRELLRASLARQGIELGSFSVVVERDRPDKKARARANDGKRKGE
jgi:flagellar hook-length control protein FliK